MHQRTMEDRVQINEDGKLVAPANPTVNLKTFDWNGGSLDMSSPTSDSQRTGSLSGAESYDLIPITLNANQTYTFWYHGTGTDPVIDPYLGLVNSSFQFVRQDDDGGLGRTAMITYTPTVGGTYYLYATSFYTIDGEPPSYDAGDYTIDIWSPNPAVDAPGTIASTSTLTEGVNFANLTSASDVDVYRIDMTEGNVYTFTYAGGIWGNTDPIGSDNIGRLDLLDSAGNVIATGLNYESRLQYVAEADGVYFLRASSYAGTTGGYTLNYEERPFTDYNPLESLNWDSAPNVPFADTNGDGVGDTAYVYFATPGQNFGMLQGETGSTEQLLSFGFNAVEQERILAALNNEYGFLLGINYVATTDVNQATFRLILTEDEPYGARFLNYDPQYGANSGIGVFVRDNAGWSYDQQQSLLEGGYDYSLLLHEFGHAHGIAHPHDTGGGSEIMLGVTAAQGSLGLFDLNQGVYTVMSYNSAWALNPAGPSPLFGSTVDNGWSGSLSALDIAILQQRYGLVERNTGDNTYLLTDIVNDAFYEAIWDSGGTDAIAYGGALDARIDLTAATLDYSPTGGGVLSFLYNTPGTTNANMVRGGFTIANGVVIENATGGSGNDVLIGNSSANVLTGNNGNDTLIGRDGVDTASYANATAGVVVSLASGTASGGNGNDTLETIENVIGSAFNDRIGGDSGNNTLNGGAGVRDIVTYAEASGGVNVDLVVGTATGAAGNDSLVGFEDVIGSGFDDFIVGNAGENVLLGGGGIDHIRGGDGLDVVTLGSGNDVFIAEVGPTQATLKTGKMPVDIITDFDASGAGNDLIDLSGLHPTAAFHFNGTNANKNAGDVTYKMYESVSGAENALGFDIDGHSGAGGVSGPVTVVYLNVDGGAADAAIILLNTNNVDASDFIFA